MPFFGCPPVPKEQTNREKSESSGPDLTAVLGLGVTSVTGRRLSRYVSDHCTTAALSNMKSRHPKLPKMTRPSVVVRQVSSRP